MTTDSYPVFARLPMRPPSVPAWRRWLARMGVRLACWAHPPHLRLVHRAAPAWPTATLESEDAVEWAMDAGGEGGMGPPDLWSDPRYAYELAQRHRQMLI